MGKIQSPSAGAVRANRTSGKPSARVFAQVRDNTPVVEAAVATPETVEEVAESSKVKVQKKMSANKGKVSCDGVFAPAVQFTRAVIGDDKSLIRSAAKPLAYIARLSRHFATRPGCRGRRAWRLSKRPNLTVASLDFWHKLRNLQPRAITSPGQYM